MRAELAGPPKRPLVGHLPAFLRDKLGFLMDCAARYGDVVPLHIGEPTFLLTNPDDIRHVLIDNGSNYVKSWRMMSRRGKRISGNGMHTAVGAEHLRQRRLLQPMHQRQTMDPFFEVMLDRVERMAAGWTDGMEIDLASEMESIALSVILGALFGIGFEDRELAAAITVRRRYIEYMYESLFPFPEYVPAPVVLAYRRASRTIEGAIRQQVEGRAAAGSFAAMFAAAEYPDGARMNFVQVRDEIVTLMSTGYETLGDALAWTLYLIARHPEVEALLVGELRDVLGGRAPAIDDIPKLVYTRQVLDESMRLYPPTWLYVRMALGDDALPSGAAIGRGAKVYLCQYVVHRNPKYFPEPERFDPERFAGSLPSRRPRFAYFPFGGGQRQCIGEQFALLEGVTVLAALLSRYRFVVSPDQVVVPRTTITLRPKGGIRAVVRSAC